MHPQLQLLLLGPPRVLLDGLPPAELVSAKAHGLLFYLAATAETYSRATLTGLFWGDQPEELARANLRQALTKLRRALGEHLVIAADTVALNPALPHSVDMRAFLQLLEAARAHPHRSRATCPSCAERGLRAAELYRHDFLHGFALADCPEFELWMVAERERLRQLALEALEHLTAFCLRRADYSAAQGYARRQLDLDPLHEPAHRQLMVALAAAGQRAAALAQYQLCARRLLDEFGAEPDQRTQSLYAIIRRGEPLAEGPARHNLPAPTTPFFGRQAELAAIRDRLEHPACRLLTLVGPGGVGKTRLAREAAAGLLPTFGDGVFLVQLAPLRDPGLVLTAIARAVGMQEAGGGLLVEQLKAWLGQRELLLLLDNFEHLLAAAPLVSELLAACPRLTVLATSREPLRLSGEHEYAVLPLPLPALPELVAPPPVERLIESSAVQLFLQRARASVPGYGASPAETALVAHICHRLDGLPLAIELAAGRCRQLAPDAMLAQLRQAAPAPLQLLDEGARDLPARHQTMRAAVAWSYNLLDEAERRSFRRLALFAGGCTAAAAAAVAAEEGAATLELIEGLLATLVEQCLLQHGGPEGQPRFAMLEVIRAYGLERLEESGELELCQQRLARYLVALVERASQELVGPEQARWIAELEAEHANLRVALAWAIETGEALVALRLSAMLWRFWDTCGYLSEGRRWLEAALKLPAPGLAAGSLDEAKPLRSAALNGLGMLALNQGDHVAARAALEESLSLRRALGNQSGVADVLNNLGIVAWRQGDYEAAQQMYEEGLAIDRASGNRQWMGYTLGNLGLVYHHRGLAERAEDAFGQGLALFREFGNRRDEAFALHNLGMVAYAQGELAVARSRYEASLAIKEELSDKWGTATTLYYLADVARAEGDLGAARSLLVRALQLSRELDMKQCLIELLEAFAALATAQGRAEAGVALFGAARRLGAELNILLQAIDRECRDRELAAARRCLTDEAFRAAWARGQRLSLDQATAAALELTA
jgi:predicted ATPase/DNA-binding SARP family transcriptional activator